MTAGAVDIQVPTDLRLRPSRLGTFAIYDGAVATLATIAAVLKVVQLASTDAPGGTWSLAILGGLAFDAAVVGALFLAPSRRYAVLAGCFLLAAVAHATFLRTSGGCACFGSWTPGWGWMLLACLLLAGGSLVALTGKRGNRLSLPHVFALLACVSVIGGITAKRLEAVDPTTANIAAAAIARAHAQFSTDGLGERPSRTIVWVYDRDCPTCQEALPEMRKWAAATRSDASALRLLLLPLNGSLSQLERSEAGVLDEPARELAESLSRLGLLTPYAVVLDDLGDDMGYIAPPAASNHASLMKRAKEILEGNAHVDK